MKYFDIPTIKGAIDHLQNYSANWLLPTFVFASNNIGTESLVDMSKALGTDQFLDKYFNGKRLDIPPMPRGNNLLRPRMMGITWDHGPCAGDYILQQDTKMWGNLFSSRGYREMRLKGLIEGEKAIVKLTDSFAPQFEEKVPDTFRFEYFLIWLFAFEGFPDEIANWTELFNHFLKEHLKLEDFKAPYKNRFKISSPELPWPTLLSKRPTNNDYLNALAPKLVALLNTDSKPKGNDLRQLPTDISGDDPIYSAIVDALGSNESLSFLLAGPPGTGKTRSARLVAQKITEGDSSRCLFLQFHPAIGYDDFIEGFRPNQGKDKDGIHYELDARLFMAFADKAKADPKKLYVAVIDELNRGDVARVFGEVLTYLEVDYREVEFTLPFSGKKTSLPKNLVLIATANPYDRSVTDLDDALLRRFWVIEVEPDGSILREHLEGLGVEQGVVNRTVQAFNTLNDAFPHGFGHTSFLGVRTVEDLAAVWNGRVKLALRRTFMHDRKTFEGTVASIESLLRGRDEGSEQEDFANSGDLEA